MAVGQADIAKALSDKRMNVLHVNACMPNACEPEFSSKHSDRELGNIRVAMLPIISCRWLPWERSMLIGVRATTIFELAMFKAVALPTWTG